ncbi:hypothetical protein CbuK_1983 [Coxiella burnetii CbuK_Q154]|nr:hypothetical protein CbuK_1983 [Coxiella burnetii CbuK_Q154]EDR36507.1 hypothetical protein COXBURSA334_2020 [Coxiella burnetii Q321]
MGELWGRLGPDDEENESDFSSSFLLSSQTENEYVSLL